MPDLPTVTDELLDSLERTAYCRVFNPGQILAIIQEVRRLRKAHTTMCGVAAGAIVNAGKEVPKIQAQALRDAAEKWRKTCGSCGGNAKRGCVGCAPASAFMEARADEIEGGKEQ